MGKSWPQNNMSFSFDYVRKRINLTDVSDDKLMINRVSKNEYNDVKVQLLWVKISLVTIPFYYKSVLL